LNLLSFAKVNLYLEVIKKRRDGYHSLTTIFERISLVDRLILKTRRDNLIKVSSDKKIVPQDEGNLCFKAAKLLRDKFEPSKGLDIKIMKRIPVGAGLGGGSSNAAAVLMGLNKLWKLDLTKFELAKFAGRVGSDVAFFVHDVSFAAASGRGERIRPLRSPKKINFCHILVVPKIHVSTPLIYDKFDRFSGLTKPDTNVKLLTSVLTKKSHSLLKPGLLFNSLEEVTIRLYPEVKRIKNALLRLGLDNVLMSGSGPAVFAITSSSKNAAKIAKLLRKRESAWRVFVVETV
jgi:4-diphosphocytidyl-2-C-methyl-D-erythritol kinase